MSEFPVTAEPRFAVGVPPEPACDTRVQGRIGRRVWVASEGDDELPPQFLFAIDTDGTHPPVDGYFVIAPGTWRAERLVRLVQTAAEHGWRVCAAGRRYPGTRVYEVTDLYTEVG